MRKFRFGLLAVALVVLVTGCGAPVAQSTQPQTPTPTVTGTSQSDFKLTSITGKPVTINPNRKTLLYFMGLGCSSCFTGEKQLAQNIQHIHAKVISVDVEPDNVSALKLFIKGTGTTWPLVIDKHQQLIRKYHIAYLDTVVILLHNKVIYKGLSPSTTTIEKKLSS